MKLYSKEKKDKAIRCWLENFFNDWLIVPTVRITVFGHSRYKFEN
jgi:hypothetical protein